MTSAERSDYRIEELGAADAARYNAFLSEGCERHPDTLRIAPGDIAAVPFATAASSEGCSLVARAASGEWLGVGTLERERGREKRRHVAWVLRMYVATPGQGVGRALLRELQRRAAALPGVSKLNLTVAAHNQAAVGLYRSEGFREFSREADAFRSRQGPTEELTMSRPLT
jgi:L-amino acid N-acyltransferase YncA